MQKLDDRTVPSSVTTTSTVRPLDFVATGTLTTTAVNASGPVAVTSTTTTNVTANGQIDYSSATQGAASLVSISGTGSGSETAVSAGTGGRVRSPKPFKVCSRLRTTTVPSPRRRASPVP